jgi:hypothetical protein
MRPPRVSESERVAWTESLQDSRASEGRGTVIVGGTLGRNQWPPIGAPAKPIEGVLPSLRAT